jgi:synaptobrevin family protein YKT6
MKHKTIESVLKRGEKLDDLIDKSNDLSALSKAMYQASRKKGCCG